MKYSIRDLIWLTVVVALVLGWWVDRSRLANHFRQTSEDAKVKSRNADAWEARATVLRKELEDRGWKFYWEPIKDGVPGGVDSVVMPPSKLPAKVVTPQPGMLIKKKGLPDESTEPRFPDWAKDLPTSSAPTQKAAPPTGPYDRARP